VEYNYRTIFPCQKRRFQKNDFSGFINVRYELNPVVPVGEIRGAVSKETEEKFRRIAMKKFGYRKGSLSKALEIALSQWIQKSEYED